MPAGTKRLASAVLGTMNQESSVIHRDRLRHWISRNLQLVVFLGAYFVTTVAGNLIFVTPWREQSLAGSSSSDRFLEFAHTFSPGYWLLLLCPFVVTPFIVVVTKRIFERKVQGVARILPEFSRLGYTIITAVCFSFVIYRFWVADVAALFSSGVDAASSVEARFMIRERIGYVTFVPLQALLPFLTLYAMVRWIRWREAFWMVVTILNTLVLSVLLIMINMKWPVLLFYTSLVLAIFVYAQKGPYLKTAVGAVFLFAAFVVVSGFVFRITPSPETKPIPKENPAAGERERHPQTSRRYGNDAVADASEQFMASAKAAPKFAPRFVVMALNRMAIAYPYYYQVFTEEGAVCGGVLAQARRDPYCRPSEMIYARIFANDGFENRGTSPAAVHISGYALGGWPVAMFALLAGSVILALFAALPIDQGPASGTMTILGAIAGYHFSQIPGEGVVFYEHGLIWPALLVLGYVAWRRWRTAALD